MSIKINSAIGLCHEGHCSTAIYIAIRKETIGDDVTQIAVDTIDLVVTKRRGE